MVKGGEGETPTGKERRLEAAAEIERGEYRDMEGRN